MSIDVLIAGVQKCGTTSLHQMLAQHPNIVTHSTGQWPYFLHDTNYQEEYKSYINTEFISSKPQSLRLVRDTSVAASEIAIARLKELSPNVRLIVMLREPISRAYSGYTFAKSKQYDIAETFEDELIEQDRFLDDISTYLVRNHVPLSMYYKTLIRLEKFFEPENIIILKSEDLRLNPIDVCNRIFNFLGLESFSVTQRVTNVTRQARFPTLQRLTKTDNVFRKWSKLILPKSFIRTGLKIISKANTSKKSFDGIPSDAKLYLKDILKDDIQKLKDKYNIDYSQ